MIGVYIIINNFNGHSYIGISNNIERRFKEHRAKSKKGLTVLCKSFRKYGLRNFTFVILETFDDAVGLFSREVYWINKISPEYNMNKGGFGNSRPVRYSTKKKISTKLKQLWIEKPENEKLDFIKNNLMGRKKGYKHSIETKEKLSKVNLGKKQSKETVKKRSDSMKSSMIGNNNGNKKIVQLSVLGVEIKEYNSLKQASEELDISSSGISKALNEVQKTCNNFKWKYKNE